MNQPQEQNGVQKQSVFSQLCKRVSPSQNNNNLQIHPNFQEQNEIQNVLNNQNIQFSNNNENSQLIAENKELKDKVEKQQQQIKFMEDQLKKFHQNLVWQLQQLRSQIHNRIESFKELLQNILESYQDLKKQSQLQQINHEFHQPNNQEYFYKNQNEIQIQQFQNNINFNSNEEQQLVNQHFLENSQYLQASTNSLQTTIAQCFLCQQQITNAFIQTNCFHNYDQHCFDEFINTEIVTKGQAQIFCLCKKAFKAKILLQTSNSQELLSILYLNQLKQLKNQLSQKCLLQECKNVSCGFFYIGQGVDNSNSVCVICEK